MSASGPRRGFTIVELLMVLAVTGILSAALARVFVSQYRAYRDHDGTMEAVGEARTALDLLVREARHAGFDPRGTAGADLTHLGSDSLGWTADLDADGRIGGSSLPGDESVLYFFDPSEAALVRRTEAGDERVARRVDAARFAFLDRTGRPADGPATVAQVRLHLRFRTVEGTPGGDMLAGVAMPNLHYRWRP